MLHGGTAVVAAVDRRAVGQFVPGGAPSTPLIAAAVRAVVERAARDGRIVCPTARPRWTARRCSQDGQKLGLGSSAAAVVAAVGALLDALGQPLDAATLLPLAVRRAPRRARRARLGRRRRGRAVRRPDRLRARRRRRAGDSPAAGRLARASWSSSAPAIPRRPSTFERRRAAGGARPRRARGARASRSPTAATRFVAAHEAGDGGGADRSCRRRPRGAASARTRGRRPDRHAGAADRGRAGPGLRRGRQALGRRRRRRRHRVLSRSRTPPRRFAPAPSG